MQQWVAKQEADFHGLAGCVITAWVGVEMALRETGATGRPEFEDPTIPLLQMIWLYAEVDGGIRRITTYQNDTNWGLRIEHGEFDLPTEEQEEGSIFRTRHLLDLPFGLVDDVTTALDQVGNLACVTFRILGRKVILQAGEVYEEVDGSPSIIQPDESILLTVMSDEKGDKGT